MAREPDHDTPLAERQAAAAAAKARLLASFKPKPTVQAPPEAFGAA